MYSFIECHNIKIICLGFQFYFFDFTPKLYKIIGKFKFIDTQFINNHLKQFGAEEISSQAFQTILQIGINEQAYFEKFALKGFLPKNLYPMINKII